MTLTETARQNVIKSRVYEEYKTRIEVLLSEIRALLNHNGYDVDQPFECTDEEFRWYMPVERNGEIVASIETAISEAVVYGDDPPTGVNFSMMITAEGGQVLGQWTPHNYTDRVWVDARDSDALERRWDEFSGVDQHGILDVLP